MKIMCAGRASGLVRRRRAVAVVVLLLIALLAPAAQLYARGAAQAPPQAARMSVRVASQINALVAEKRARTAVQRKIDSQLIYGARIAAGRAIAAGVTSLRVRLPMTADNRALIDVRAPISDALLGRLRGLGAEVIGANARYRHVALRVPLDLVEAIAAIPEVVSVVPDFGYMTSRGVTPALRTIAGPPTRTAAAGTASDAA